MQLFYTLSNIGPITTLQAPQNQWGIFQDYFVLSMICCATHGIYPIQCPRIAVSLYFVFIHTQYNRHSFKHNKYQSTCVIAFDITSVDVIILVLTVRNVKSVTPNVVFIPGGIGWIFRNSYLGHRFYLLHVPGAILTKLYIQSIYRWQRHLKVQSLRA